MPWRTVLFDALPAECYSLSVLEVFSADRCHYLGFTVGASPWVIPPRSVSTYLPESWCSTLFTSECGVVLLWTSCAITRCREIMTPQLSIVKTRFAKASLRPRCARHRSWGATCLFPNACVGHSATQCLRGILTDPMVALKSPAHMVAGSSLLRYLMHDVVQQHGLPI